MSDDFKIEFTNNSKEIKRLLADECKQFLTDAGQIVKSQVRDLSRRKSGQLKDSFNYHITTDDGDMAVKIGSPLENAIWEEFGTGEYALEGNGRKGGWYYEDEKGEGHFTHGKTPSRALYYAIKNSRSAIESRLKELGGVFK